MSHALLVKWWLLKAGLGSLALLAFDAGGPPTRGLSPLCWDFHGGLKEFALSESLTFKSEHSKRPSGCYKASCNLALARPESFP